MAEITSSRTSEADYAVTGAYIRWSSWTVRIITLLEYFSIPYSFKELSKATPEGLQAIRSTPAGWVPTLKVSSLSNTTIHDSLSIAEFLAESHPNYALWPTSRRHRALARSIVAEMHSGFTNLRYTYHSNFVSYYAGEIPTATPEIKKEVVRLLEIFDSARRETIADGVEGPYLFGEFGIADSFFWPVLWRFRTYNVDISSASPLAKEWIRTMWKDPKLVALGKRIYAESKDPATSAPEYENLYPGKATMEYFDENVVYEPNF